MELEAPLTDALSSAAAGAGVSLSVSVILSSRLSYIGVSDWNSLQVEITLKVGNTCNLQCKKR